LSLQKLITELATETQRDFDRVAKQFALRHRSRSPHQIDQRIDALLCAIRKQNHSRK
jgi:hypothetical protein